MLGEGNADVAVCSHNLLTMMQREVPFARSKGMNPDIYDMPFDEAEGFLDESARNVLGAYEGRVDVETVELEFGDGGEPGDAAYTATVIQASLDEDSDEYWEGDD